MSNLQPNRITKIRYHITFNRNHSGVEASAILYCIIETAKANGLIPFDYIKHCLKQLSHLDFDFNSV
nr:transposase domain-containing protein [Shewanella inventionis]